MPFESYLGASCTSATARGQSWVSVECGACRGVHALAGLNQQPTFGLRNTWNLRIRIYSLHRARLKLWATALSAPPLETPPCMVSPCNHLPSHPLSQVFTFALRPRTPGTLLSFSPPTQQRRRQDYSSSRYIATCKSVALGILVDQLQQHACDTGCCVQQLRVQGAAPVCLRCVDPPGGGPPWWPWWRTTRQVSGPNQ